MLDEDVDPEDGEVEPEDGDVEPDDVEEVDDESAAVDEDEPSSAFLAVDDALDDPLRLSVL